MFQILIAAATWLDLIKMVLTVPDHPTTGSSLFDIYLSGSERWCTTPIGANQAPTPAADDDDSNSTCNATASGIIDTCNATASGIIDTCIQPLEQYNKPLAYTHLGHSLYVKIKTFFRDKILITIFLIGKKNFPGKSTIAHPMALVRKINSKLL